MAQTVKLSERFLLHVLNLLDSSGGHIRWEVVSEPHPVFVGRVRRYRKLQIFGTEFGMMRALLDRAFDILSAKRLIACVDKSMPQRLYFVTPLGRQALATGAL